MFERFTRGARDAIAAAAAEARALGAGAIGCTHLLLGAASSVPELDVAALREAERDAAGSRDADALAGLGIDLDAVRRQADETFGPGALESTRAGRRTPRFAPGAKRALELALGEALRLRDKRIGPEHVVLGVLQTDDPRIGLLLEHYGSSVPELRAAMEQALRRTA